MPRLTRQTHMTNDEMKRRILRPALSIRRVDSSVAISLLKYPDRVLLLYGRIKAFSIINYVQMLSLAL
jgi:hypothetical protein